MKRWYVIQTKPRQEKLAKDNLNRQHYECYLPCIKKWKKLKGKRYLGEEVLFPNYVFIYMDLYLTNCSPIRSTRGVNKLVSFGNEILPVPYDVMGPIIQYSENNSKVSNVVDFLPGQEVKIDQGVFSGLSAIFMEKKGETRAILLLHLLGGNQKVELTLDALEC